jgi:hypothetical protein
MTFRDQIHGLLGVATRQLGEPVVYTATNRDPVSVTGVFDATGAEIDPSTGAVIVSTKPTLGIRDSDLPATPQEGDRVTICEVVYRVIEVMVDGQGGSLLKLHKV